MKNKHKYKRKHVEIINAETDILGYNSKDRYPFDIKRIKIDCIGNYKYLSNQNIPNKYLTIDSYIRCNDAINSLLSTDDSHMDINTDPPTEPIEGGSLSIGGVHIRDKRDLDLRDAIKKYSNRIVPEELLALSFDFLIRTMEDYIKISLVNKGVQKFLIERVKYIMTNKIPNGVYLSELSIKFCCALFANKNERNSTIIRELSNVKLLHIYDTQGEYKFGNCKCWYNKECHKSGIITKIMDIEKIIFENIVVTFEMLVTHISKWPKFVIFIKCSIYEMDKFLTKFSEKTRSMVFIYIGCVPFVRKLEAHQKIERNYLLFHEIKRTGRQCYNTISNSKRPIRSTYKVIDPLEVNKRYIFSRNNIILSFNDKSLNLFEINRPYCAIRKKRTSELIQKKKSLDKTYGIKNRIRSIDSKQGSAFIKRLIKKINLIDILRLVNKSINISIGNTRGDTVRHLIKHLSNIC